jgi:hypothetical protein
MSTARAIDNPFDAFDERHFQTRGCVRHASTRTRRARRPRARGGDDDDGNDNVDVDARGIALDVRGGVRDANERARPIARVRIALDAIHVVSVANAVVRARIRSVDRRRWCR